jgi:hypothetical protein
VRMGAEHQRKSWPEIKALSKNRIWWQAFIKAVCLSEGWKDILLLLYHHHHMALQPNLGPDLPLWGFITISF